MSVWRRFFCLFLCNKWPTAANAPKQRRCLWVIHRYVVSMLARHTRCVFLVLHVKTAHGCALHLGHVGVCSSELSHTQIRNRTKVMVTFRLEWITVGFLSCKVCVSVCGYFVELLNGAKDLLENEEHLSTIRLWLRSVWTLGKHLHRPQEPKVSAFGWVSSPNSVAFVLLSLLRESKCPLAHAHTRTHTRTHTHTHAHTQKCG